MVLWTPPTIDHTISRVATSGCSMTVMIESRASPEPPAIAAGAIPTLLSSSARVDTRSDEVQGELQTLLGLLLHLRRGTERSDDVVDLRDRGDPGPVQVAS